jgi:hypothetical protein
MTNNHEHLDNDTIYNTSETSETFLEQGDGSYYAVYDNPHTGVTSLGPLKTGGPNRNPRREIRLDSTTQSSARASRQRLRDHAVYRQLGACLVLTYAELPMDAKKDVERFLKKAQKYYPYRMHYAVVTEGGCNESEKRIHHNVFLPASPNLFLIAECWTHGGVFVGINTTDKDIRRAVNYVSKEFVRSSGLNSRFKKSKSMTPKPVKEVFENRQDAEAALMAKIPKDATGVSIYEPGCAGRVIAYRDVNPHQI